MSDVKGLGTNIVRLPGCSVTWTLRSAYDGVYVRILTPGLVLYKPFARRNYSKKKLVSEALRLPRRGHSLLVPFWSASCLYPRIRWLSTLTRVITLTASAKSIITGSRPCTACARRRFKARRRINTAACEACPGTHITTGRCLQIPGSCRRRPIQALFSLFCLPVLHGL